jgi:hypothetical protein
MTSPRGCHSLRDLGGSTSKWCFVPLSMFALSYSRWPPTVVVLTDWVARTPALGWGSLQARTASRGMCLVAGAKTSLTTPLGVRPEIRRRISTGRYTPQHTSAEYPWCGRPTSRVPALRSVAYARHERVGSRWSIGWAGSRRSRRRQGRPSRFGGQYVHPAADVSSGEYGLNSLSFDLRVTQRWIGGTDVPVFGLVGRKQSRSDQGA